ncbi:MAG TPA: shikimate dehydrogenase [bacterium]|nr:shikimate dehydrogenase [bacterium]
MQKKQATGIIGFPLSHTLSPAMHNTVYKKYRMNREYLVYETKPGELKAMIKRIKTEKIAGVNVTIPYKQAVMRYLDRVDRAARAIGAVNTIVNKKSGLIGYNTDYTGFLRTLKEKKIKLKDKKVVMFGAGGAAHAVAYAINMQKPKEFHIYNIDIPMIENLAEKIRLKNVCMGTLVKSAAKDDVIAAADLIINATSVGMNGKSAPYKISRLKKTAVVYDIIYNPPKTPLLKNAQKKGARIINGLDMLIYQGMDSFKLWTGRNSDYKTVVRALARVRGVK